MAKLRMFQSEEPKIWGAFRT